MKKVGVCGAYGTGPECTGGQPVKTRMLIDGLINNLGKYEVETVSTYHWKRRPFILIKNCIQIMRHCDNVIILPAHNGVKVFSVLFTVLNLLWKRNLHYVVIGGWLPELVDSSELTKHTLMRFKGIYVETKSMLKDLNNRGFTNVYIINNFKNLKKMDDKDLSCKYSEPLKLVFFSRVVKEKGIEDAIYAVEKVNRQLGREVYHLDVYGLLSDNYKQRFYDLVKNAPEYITYKGLADPDDSVKVLNGYFAQLFPTRFRTEGIPGSIIDSYFAGVPVISSKWNSFGDVITEHETGVGYEIGDVDSLIDVLIKISDKPNKIIGMKKACIEKADEYSIDKVMEKFLEYL